MAELDEYPPLDTDTQLTRSDFSISADTYTSFQLSGGSYTSSEELESLTNQAVRSFRLRYLCTQSCNHFRRDRSSRIPRGKAVYLVLLMCFFERLAFYSALGNIITPFLESTSLSSAKQALIRAICQNIIAQCLYPLAGWLADVWLGRYRTIHMSLWVLWIGYSIVAFSFSFSKNVTLTYFLLVGYLIISMGTAAFQANVIPFGADQIVYRASEELSSYFYWYYWVRNVGAIFYVSSFTCTNFSNDLHVTVFATAAAASIAAALSLNAIFNDWLLIDPERRNPLKTVVKVLYHVATAKRPTERSAFSFSRVPPPRIDLAKQRHGGKFTNEEVEDVKTFLRLLLILISITSAFTVYTGVTSVTVLQVHHMSGNYLEFNITSACTFDASQWGVNIVTIITIIPILNQLVFPCLREYAPSMLKKMGIGYFLALLSPLILFLFEGLGQHSEKQCMFFSSEYSLSMNAWLILIPQTAVNIAEVLLVASSLEFLYAQSPHNMRGMMIGLFFFVKGIFSTIAAIILFFFSNKDTGERPNNAKDCGFWYYLIFLVFALIGFPLYLVVSRWYKNRQRGELEESVAFYRESGTTTQ